MIDAELGEIFAGRNVCCAACDRRDSKVPSASAVAKVSRSRFGRLDGAGGAADRRVEAVGDVDEGTVDDVVAGGGVSVFRLVWVMPSGSATLVCTSSAHGLTGDRFDDLAEGDVVGVQVAVRTARLAHPSGRLGDGDQLGRRPWRWESLTTAGWPRYSPGPLVWLSSWRGVIRSAAGRSGK